MTDRLDEIRARWQATTAGPWELDDEGRVLGGEGTVAMKGALLPPDARAIAAAPEDIAFLLGEVARLTADRERLVREAFLMGAFTAPRGAGRMAMAAAEKAAVRCILGDET